MDKNYDQRILDLEASKRRVPSSGRGGLGNIKARKKAKSTSLSPSSYRFTPSARNTHPISLSELSASGSGSTQSSAGSILSHSDMDSRNLHSSSSLEDGSEHVHRASSEPSSPVRPLSVRTTHTFGSIATPGAATSSTGDEYKACLSADAQQRADGKRNELARQKESGSKKGGCEDNELFKRVRTGRGGAGVIVRASGEFINEEIHPLSGAVTREKEAQLLAMEQSIISASRTRFLMSGSTGRGGSGNISSASKKKHVSAKKLAKMERAAAKGKGKAEQNDQGSDDPETSRKRSLSLPPFASRDLEHGQQSSTQHPPTKRRLSSFWRRAAVPAEEHSRTHYSNQSLHGPPNQPGEASCPTETFAGLALDGPSDNPPASSAHTLGHEHNASRRRNTDPHRDKPSLAFVNAKLRDSRNGRSTQNVFGVAGTPGFPSSVMAQHSIAEKDEKAYYTSPVVIQSGEDREWFDDSALDDDDEDDSDIDPDVHPRVLSTGEDNSPPGLRVRISASSGLSVSSSGTFGPVELAHEYKPPPVVHDRYELAYATDRPRNALSWSSSTKTSVSQSPSSIPKESPSQSSLGQQTDSKYPATSVACQLNQPGLKPRIPSSRSRLGSPKYPPPLAPVPHLPQIVS